MTRTEYLLTCMAEECNEVAQRASKALRFGLHEVQPGQELTNAARIIQEWVDLVAVVEFMLADEGILNLKSFAGNFDSMILAKKEKVEKFMAYSKELGTLQD